VVAAVVSPYFFGELYYTSELRQRGYDGINCYLPHDGVNANSVTGLRCIGTTWGMQALASR
jgi:hypothetical protein